MSGPLGALIPSRPFVAAILLLSGALLAPASSLLAQTTAQAELVVHVERDAYTDPDQPVNISATYYGSLPRTGHFRFQIDRLADECPTDSGVYCAAVYSYAIWTAELAGQTLTYGGETQVVWNQTLRNGLETDGDWAGAGRYYVSASFCGPTACQLGAESAPFSLSAGPAPNPPPEIQIGSPLNGTTYRSTEVPVFVRVTDDTSLSSVRVVMDGRAIASRPDLAQRSYELDQKVTLEPGSHRLEVLATDEHDLSSSAMVTFGVWPLDAARLTVYTEREIYWAGEPVQVVLRNDGGRALDGTPQIAIYDGSGAAVWQLVTAQIVRELPPAGEETYTWDQRTDDGDRAPAGEYSVRASWGGARGNAKFTIIRDEAVPGFAVRVLAPPEGTVQRDKVVFVIDIGPPGATKLAVHVEGPSQFDSGRSFPYAVEGKVEHPVDMRGAIPGDYRATVHAVGPGGEARTAATFRVAPSNRTFVSDTLPPDLSVENPASGETVFSRFPILFHVQDDVGIVYAEAYIGSRLVGRHEWTEPVMRGAFVATLPFGETGVLSLQVVAYDLGKHRDLETVSIVAAAGKPPCAEVAAEAHAAMGADEKASSGAPRSATGATVVADLCPPPTLAAHGRYAAIEVHGVRVFDSVALGDGGLHLEARVETKGRAFVVDAPGAGLVQLDLNGTWLVTQRGRHVILENRDDGTRLMLLIVGGSPSLLGQRVVADLGASGKIVARPIGPTPLDSRLAEAIMDGFVGAEVLVTPDAAASPEALSYSDLGVTVEIEGERLLAVLSSPDHGGRTLVFTLEEGSPLGEDVDVLLDGERLVRASSLEDVLSPHDDAGESEYYVVQDDGATKVLVSVGHFSTRELVIQAADIAAPFLTPLALLGGLGVVGAAAVALFRRDNV